jgi:hypothetical protein
MSFEQQITLIKESGFLDEDWYLEKYRDVAALDMPPAEHYLKYGALMGRDPGPAFSSRFYLEANSDVATGGVNPLLHYIQHGKSENRQTAHSNEA